MFIFTAKLNKKKAIIAVLLLAVVICAVILIAGLRSTLSASETGALSAVVRNNEQRVGYLRALGWEVEEEPIEEQSILIPRSFTGAYAEYNKLQEAQGFDLSDYCGLEATRFTYRILNYGSDDTVVADLIVCRNEVVAGDVQSTALDGFMHGLKK